jgi:hypothetical protein
MNKCLISIPNPFSNSNQNPKSKSNGMKRRRKEGRNAFKMKSMKIKFFSINISRKKLNPMNRTLIFSLDS